MLCSKGFSHHYRNKFLTQCNFRLLQQFKICLGFVGDPICELLMPKSLFVSFLIAFHSIVTSRDITEQMHILSASI